MRKYTKEQVVQVLRESVAKASTARVAAELGVVPQLLSMVVLGQREISASLAFKLGFVKLPDSFVRTPKQPTQKKA